MTPETSTAPAETAEDMARTHINNRLKEGFDQGQSSPAQLLRRVEEKTDHLSEAIRSNIHLYVQEIGPMLAGKQVERLPEKNIGGYNQGSKIAITEETLRVNSSIRQTIDQTNEATEHEEYHEEHGHTDPIQIAPSAQGETVVTIGKESFTHEGVTEGVTVFRTGDTFVSERYRQLRARLVAAVATSGQTMADVEEALNEKKDLSLIDDEERAKRQGSLDRQFASVN